MSIQLKIACTPKEIDDALWLRHEVYVKEEGKYSGRSWPDERLVDRFDAFPKVAHIIAYDADQPIATLRVNGDMGQGLPPEAHFDFKSFLPNQLDDSATQPIIGAAGLLVIRQDWRRRHNLLPALYRKAAGVLHSWNVTHVIAIVSQTTARFYRHLGFKPLAEAFVIESIGDTVVPILARAEDGYRWAFGDSGAPHEPVWPERRRSHHSSQQIHVPLIATRDASGRRASNTYT